MLDSERGDFFFGFNLVVGVGNTANCTHVMCASGLSGFSPLGFLK